MIYHLPIIPAFKFPTDPALDSRDVVQVVAADVPTDVGSARLFVVAPAEM